MKVLVVGSGGREHALAWKLARRARRRRTSSARRATPGIAAASPRSSPSIAARSRRRCSRSPSASASISPSSVPSCRSIAASSICFAPRAAASSARRAPPRSSSAARCSRRSSWRATAFRRRAIASATTPPSAHAVRRVGRARLSGRRQGRRARGGQGRRRRRRSRRRRTRAIRAAMEERQFGDAGARVVLEECLDRARGVVLRDLRRHARGAADVGAGSQAHLRRRRGPEHRRHGRVRAEPAGRRGDAGARSCARSSSRSLRGHARRRAPSTAASSTPG